MPGTGLANAEQVFCGRIDGLNQETAIDDDDSGSQVVKDVFGPGWLSAALRFFCGWVRLAWL